MKVSLIVMNPGKTAGHAIPITLSQFIIGRDPQCNLRPASPVISKRHCAILIKNGKVTVRDFDSTNGTFIGDTPVKGEVPLNHDNILKVGPLTFKVVIEKTVPVDKPTPPPKKNPGCDDDVANMLLSLPEKEDMEPPSEEEEEGVPGGSTVMDMKALPMTALGGNVAGARTPTPPQKPAAAAKPAAPAARKSVAPPPPAVEEPAAEFEEEAEAEAEIEEEAEIEAEAEEEIEAEAEEEIEAEAEPEPEPAPQMEERKPEPKKPEDKKPPQHASARDAARAILEKYVKRNRGG